MALTTEQKEKIIELRAKDYSFDKIHKELNISKQTLVKYSMEFEKEIQNAKYLEIDNLLKEHSLNKQKRIETFTKLLNKLYNKLNEIDISNMNLKDITELIQKYESLKEKELNNISYKTGKYKSPFDTSIDTEIELKLE